MPATVPGTADARYGTVAFNDDAAGAAFVNYVSYIEELSPAVRATIGDMVRGGETITLEKSKAMGDDINKKAQESVDKIEKDAK